MTSTAFETVISADAKVPMIKIVRGFDAPRDKVLRAHTDPDILKQWIGPRDCVVTIDHFQCHTGGSWRYLISDGSGEKQGFHGSFHEVRPTGVIVQTFTWEGMPDGVALERLTLEDLGNGRTRLVATSLVDSFEARDAILASGMDTGVRDGYEKLDAILARTTA